MIRKKKAFAIKVVKFGGSSLADARQVRKVFEIVRADPERRIVVVSAPGKRSPEDMKVTDLLIALAEAQLAGAPTAAALDRVVERYREIQRALELPVAVTSDVENDLRRRLAGDTTHRGRFFDNLKAAGEDNCARVVAAVFNKLGLPSHYVDPREAGLLLSDDFGNATVLPESFDRLKLLRDTPDVAIFPGFFGYTVKGEVATFPRGGSDITGSILAAAVKADLYENFTDVDSVYAVDPRIVPDARAISVITYQEMRELAYAGFGVFHDEAILPAVQAKIPICIKNTNHPEAPGTRIVPERPYASGVVVGIVGAEGFCTRYVSKYLMNREIGFGRRLLQIVEDEGLSYEHAPSGIDNTSVILREQDVTPEIEARLCERVRDELGANDVGFEHGLALLMIVGEGMRYTVGLSAKACTALAAAGVNIDMINQGSSEISVMFGIKATDRKRAIKALYNAFFP